MNATFRSTAENFKRAHSMLLVVAVMMLPAGCSDQKTATRVQSSQKVTIKGSNTVGEELAPRLITEYKKGHPDCSIEIETKGSGSGFWGLIAGVCDIAASSRSPNKDEEQQAKVRGIELQDYMIGSYSVAVIANGNCPVTNLSKEQVRDLFTGTIQNWKEVGGPDAPVHLYTRDPISGTYLGFRELALEDKAYAANIKTFTNYEGIVQAVASDPGGIGYASIQLASKPGVKPIAIAGVAPDVAAVKDGKYPYARKLHLYTNKAHEGSPAHQFIAFIMSADGQKIMDQMGYVPKP